MHTLSAQRHSSIYEVIQNFNFRKCRSTWTYVYCERISVHNFETFSITFLAIFDGNFDALFSCITSTQLRFFTYMKTNLHLRATGFLKLIILSFLCFKL